MRKRVLVDARVRPGEPGGLEQYVLGLSRGLIALSQDTIDLVFLVFASTAEWFTDQVPGAVVFAVPDELSTVGTGVLLTEQARRVAPRLLYLMSHLPLPTRMPRYRVPRGLPEVQLVHFTTQSAFETSCPFIYQPHDLQHIHLPDHFSWRRRKQRDLIYRHYCKRAAAVVVVSNWVKNDIIAHYGIEATKIHVVPYAPPTANYPTIEGEAANELRERLRLPHQFAFYPAQTWAHKNHIGLLKALRRLRDEGLIIPLVCSGRKTDYFPSVWAEVERLELRDQIHFVGFVAPAELRFLYRSARIVTVPTLFEAASFPIWEAFAEHVPVACSNVTSLPELAEGAAAIFDPKNVDDMADAIRRVWVDERVRDAYAREGARRVAALSWEKTALAMIRLYESLSVPRAGDPR